MRYLALLLVAATSGSVVAAPPKSSADFAGYAEVKFRDAPATVKDFAKVWTLVVGGADDRAESYAAKAPPAFLGVKVDKSLLLVSKHLHIVVMFALTFSGERCAAVENALDGAWGPSRVIGGAHHEIEWPSKKVDASLEHQGADCVLTISDKGWDDTADKLKP